MKRKILLTAGVIIAITLGASIYAHATCPGCDCSNICCSPDEHVVQVSSHFNE